MNTPFLITATLASPMVVLPQSYLTLDSLLWHAVNAERDGQATLDDLPLAREQGVFCGSAAFVKTLAASSVAPFKRSIPNTTFKREEFVIPGRKRPYVDQARGPYRALMQAYRAYDTETVVWYGRGNPQACLRLLQAYVPAVGKKARQGYGQVSQWEVTELGEDEDGSLFITHLGQRLPTRPIAVPIWRALGGTLDGQNVGPHGVTLPYWLSDPQPCVLPASRTRFWLR